MSMSFLTRVRIDRVWTHTMILESKRCKVPDDAEFTDTKFNGIYARGGLPSFGYNAANPQARVLRGGQQKPETIESRAEVRGRCNNVRPSREGRRTNDRLKRVRVPTYKSLLPFQELRLYSQPSSRTCHARRKFQGVRLGSRPI